MIGPRELGEVRDGDPRPNAAVLDTGVRGVKVFGDQWVDDLDVSLDHVVPGPSAADKATDLRPRAALAADARAEGPAQPQPRPGSTGRSWLKIAAWTVLTLTLVAVIGAVLAGGAGAFLVAAAAAVLAWLIGTVPMVDVVTVPESQPSDAPAISQPSQPAESTAPSARPTPKATPSEGTSDAELVVMPDPGFRSQPVDQAKQKLERGATSGAIPSEAGR